MHELLTLQILVAKGTVEVLEKDYASFDIAFELRRTLHKLESNY